MGKNAKRPRGRVVDRTTILMIAGMLIVLAYFGFSLFGSHLRERLLHDDNPNLEQAGTRVQTEPAVLREQPPPTNGTTRAAEGIPPESGKGIPGPTGPLPE